MRHPLVGVGIAAFVAAAPALAAASTSGTWTVTTAGRAGADLMGKYSSPLGSGTWVAARR